MEADKKALKRQKMNEQLEDYKKWKDLGWPAQHWRAWGSWFSWGSPVGLGLFFVLGSIAAAILIWVIKL
jgi:hypothetical protein